jgi:hypothetical protein
MVLQIVELFLHLHSFLLDNCNLLYQVLVQNCLFLGFVEGYHFCFCFVDPFDVILIQRLYFLLLPFVLDCEQFVIG